MRRVRVTLAFVGAAAVAVFAGLPSAGGATVSAGTSSPDCPWVHSTAPISQRVQQLLAAMTLNDKITMVDGAGFSFGSFGYAGHIAAIPRLCMPGLDLEDGPAGVADGVTGVTQLPAPTALAATWDPALANLYGGVVGAEEHGKGAGVDLGPTVNIVRDPRWGRAFETYGEDPFLSGQTAVGYIDGLQAQDVMAQVKHWDVYNNEKNRNTPRDDIVVSQRTMHEIYMPQFEAAVEQGGAASVMCSYSWILGEAACQNTYIMDVLKGEWNFPGFVTSDWGATHSAAPSANAGLDMDMPGGEGFGTNYFGQPLKNAVQQGRVTIARLDDMVTRILTEMFRFDFFAMPPQGSLTNTVTDAQHAAVGKTVAENGTVLLKNSDRVLPLQSSTAPTIAVLGADAGSAAVTSGGGSAGVVAPYTVTPVRGITARAAESDIHVTYAQGDVPVSGALAPLPASAYPSGLTAAYYNNTSMTGPPVATGSLSELDQNWSGSPAPGVNANGWSAKITGQIRVPVSGMYDLSLTISGQATVLVNGKRIIGGPGGFTGAASRRKTVHLDAGTFPLEVDYGAPSLGASILQFGWVSPAQQARMMRQAVAAATQARVAVVFASRFESEGADLADIDLPATENDLINAVARANPNTVVVLNTGSAVTMPWIDNVKGIVEAWYPGQDDGTAIAAILFGDVNPSGKLPVTFPTSLATVPDSAPAQWPGANGRVSYSEGLLVGYRWYSTENIAPLFPFGFGLSYTNFSFANVHVSRDSTGTTVVSADVTNSGSRAGADVVQVYVHAPASTGEPAVQLKGFAKVTLRAHHTQKVWVTLDSHAFSWWNPGTRTWTITPGHYQVLVGDSSAHLPIGQQIWVGSSG